MRHTTSNLFSLGRGRGTTCPGNHVTIMGEPHVESLAGHLRDRLSTPQIVGAGKTQSRDFGTAATRIGEVIDPLEAG